MGFWFALLLFVASTVVSVLLQKKPKDAIAASMGDFQAPTAQEGRPIPVAFGTCKLSGPNVTWWGNLNVQPIRKSSGGFLGIGAKHVTVGYRYNMDMALALCHGQVDALLDIIVGGKSVAGIPPSDYNLPFLGITLTVNPVLPALPANYATGGSSLTLSMETLFGGEDKEGGIAGGMLFYFGDSYQSAPGQLNAVWGGTAPAYRGLCYAFFSGYVGTSQYLKDWAFVVRRCPTPAGMDSSKANISGDANPAYMAMEVLQSTIWGLGIPTGRFGSSWQGAANTLFTEGLGMSLVIDNATTADQVLQEICRTTDMVVYTDPATGLWEAKLARADYDASTLLEFTSDDLLEAPKVGRGAWSETINVMLVEYTDRANSFSTQTAQAQESANYAIQTLQAKETLTFHGISNRTNALKLAMRELKTNSYPLAVITIKVNRKAWALRPGSPFKLTWQPPVGPAWQGMVVRVTSIRYGNLEDAAIEIQCVEDIFAVAATAYADPGNTGWIDPMTQPANPLAEALLEVPYQFTGDHVYAMGVCARGDRTSYAAEIWCQDPNAVYQRTNDMDTLTPTGVLASTYSYRTSAMDATGFTIAAGSTDLDRLIGQNTDSNGRLRGDHLAWFPDTGELASWTTVTANGDGSYTFAGVLRGVLDTVPADHNSGARVWFMTEGAALTQETEFASGTSTLVAKILPKNARGVVPLTSVSSVSLTMATRCLSPYPPGNFKVNSLGYSAWPTTTLDDAAITWSHRNRVTQGHPGQMIPQDTAGSYTPEGNYTLDVLVGGVVKQSYTALSGTSQTYTAAQRVADDTDGSKTVQMRMKPINGSFNGIVRTAPAFQMSGVGMCLGQVLGGNQA